MTTPGPPVPGPPSFGPTGPPPFGLPPRPPGPEREPALPAVPAQTDRGSGPWPAWLQAELFAQRTVFLRGPVDDAAAARAAAELMTHDGADDDPITLIIDAAGGTLAATFALIDTIDLVGVPVECTCLGRAHGPAAAIAAVCDRRRATRHAQLRLCLPDAAAQGRARDLELWKSHHDAQVERLTRRLAWATGRQIEHVERDLHAGRYFDAEQARLYGLIDEVLDRAPTIRPLPHHLGNRDRFGFHPG